MENNQENKQHTEHIIEPETKGPEVNIASATEKHSDADQKVDGGEEAYEYVTGIKLWLVVASVTLIAFLMMLDMSIIVTVSFYRINSNFSITDYNIGLFRESLATSTHFLTSAGMEVRICSQGIRFSCTLLVCSED
jgi:hypothetical protein